jgi:DNA-binding CsgD family transcriptional regulator
MTTTQRLRPVERRVLRLVEEGLDDAEIGRRFGRGERWTAQVRFLADLDVPRSHDGGADTTDEPVEASADTTDEPVEAGADVDRPAHDRPRDDGGEPAGGVDGSRSAESPTHDSGDGDGDGEGDGDEGIAGVASVAGVERLRPLERRLLRWRAQGVDHDELADRFRHSAEFLARVEEYAHYKLAAAG